MTLAPCPLEDRLDAIDAGMAWIDEATDRDLAAAVEAGLIDDAIHRSSGEGFSLGALLCARPKALERALAAGWRADRPCVFSSRAGQRTEWMPFDAVAYEATPLRMSLDDEAACLRRLGEAGAPMAAPNPMGETALHMAAKAQNTRENGQSAPNPVLRAIMERVAGLDAPDARGQTALHVARGAQNIVDLLQAGADVSAMDIRGRRALDAVMEKPEGPMARALHERALLEADGPRSGGVRGAPRRL